MKFDPKLLHEVTPAIHWVIAGYTPLGTSKLRKECLDTLSSLGFRLPELKEPPPKVCKLVGPNPQMMQPPRRSRDPPPRPGPGRAGMHVRFARMSEQEWAELCQLDEEQFEQRFDQWQRVLGGTNEDPGMNPLSSTIPQQLLVATVLEGRDWDQDPVLSVRRDDGATIPVARVFQFSDDGYVDDMPFSDRMLLFSIHDYPRDVLEMIILRVEMIEVPEQPELQDSPLPPLDVPGPPPPEIRAIRAEQHDQGLSDTPCLPFPLPNPTCIRCSISRVSEEAPDQTPRFAAVNKAEAAATKELESVLNSLQEPLSVTHTASQEEVRANLSKWKPAIEKELRTLKEPGVLISHKGQDARERLMDPQTTVIPIKGVFTAKPPGNASDGLFRRKCRLVGCGNQASHVDADSLYAAGAPAEVVRTALIQASRNQWSAFTTDIKSAFTQTPIPPHAARRYLLRPPRWMIDLGLAEPGEYYSLGMVLYGFKEAPAWWSDHRDMKLRSAQFVGCHLEQGGSDLSIWKIKRGTSLVGYLITYVDDFLVLSEGSTAKALHQWLIEEAKWETDGLSEATPETSIRFLGMQLSAHSDGHFSLDQEAYVDELIRAYQLSEGAKAKVVCPRELLMSEPEFPQPHDEQAVRAAQRIAGECLWLSQRSRPDISFTTAILCSKVSKDPHGAMAVGQRLLAYLHQTKDYKLHLRSDPAAAPLRVFTDASFSPQGSHSFGGHVIEVHGAPVLWRASRQAIIALSSSEAELVQAVEGSMYTESLMTVIQDLEIPCSVAELHLDNTASISFIEGAGNQRTRHLKVRGNKIRQLVNSGWIVKHCRGEFQKADLMTKPLPSARVRFLCHLLQLRGETSGPTEEMPVVKRLQASSSPCLSGLLMMLQSCLCQGAEADAGENPGVAIEWPWELGFLTLLIVLSTLFLWEASGAPCRRRREEPTPRVRALSVEKRERRSKKLRDCVSAAIDQAISESPTSEETQRPTRKGRNKCPGVEPLPQAFQEPVPTVVYGGINMNMPLPRATEGVPMPPPDDRFPGTPSEVPFIRSSYPASSSSSGAFHLHAHHQVEPTGPVEHPGFRGSRQGEGTSLRNRTTQSQAVQTDPVVVLGPQSHVYLSDGGGCVHSIEGCRGLRQAGHIKSKTLCQYCLRNRRLDE